jgi:hypothetical protein
MNVIGFEKTMPECYRRLKDAIRHESDYVTDNAVDYVREVFNENREKLVAPGVRAFIPGQTKTTSHDDIADFLHKEEGFVVIIINGRRKEILVPGKEPIDLSGYVTIGESGELPEEFSTQVAKMYKKNNWKIYPLAITGFNCVSRGVTFQCAPSTEIHDGFVFDYGIFPPISNKAEAYQTMARVFGNVGNFPNYTPVEIYTTSAMFSKVERLEEIAVNLAKMVHEQNIPCVSKKELKDAQNFETESNWELYTDEFSTLKEATKYVNAHGARGTSEKSLKKEGEFYLSSTTGKLSIMNYDATKTEMATWSKLSTFDVKTTKTSASRMFICYRDTSNPNSVVFICRVVKRKD